MSSMFVRRTMSVTRKEVLHLLRDPATLFFAIFIPVLELFMLGYAIDMNVRNVRTVIFDQPARRRAGRCCVRLKRRRTLRSSGRLRPDDCALRGDRQRRRTRRHQDSGGLLAQAPGRADSADPGARGRVSFERGSRGGSMSATRWRCASRCEWY